MSTTSPSVRSSRPPASGPRAPEQAPGEVARRPGDGTLQLPGRSEYRSERLEPSVVPANRCVGQCSQRGPSLVGDLRLVEGKHGALIALVDHGFDRFSGAGFLQYLLKFGDAIGVQGGITQPA